MGCASSADTSGDLLQYFHRTPFSLKLTDPQDLEQFSQCFILKKYTQSNITLFEQNDTNGNLYLILDGEVELRVDNKYLCSKTNGDMIGTICTELIPVACRPTTCKAIIKSTTSNILLLTQIKMRDYISTHKQCQIILNEICADYNKLLSKLSFFRGIDEYTLSLLGNMLRCIALKQGEILFEEGSKGNALYIIVNGIASATSVIASGQTKLLHDFIAGDVFGEISLLMDIPRTATMTAKTDLILFELNKDSFQKFIKLVPSTVSLHSIMKSRVAEHFRKYKVPFFESIPDEKYPILASLCKIQSIPADTVIFKEGDIGHSFYLIAHGEVRVTARKKDSADHTEENVLTTMGPGKYFGEIALVQDIARTASVTTITRCVILSITKENFSIFFNEAPEAIADFEIKLARYDVQLRSVIYHPIGLEYFTLHLKREYSEENIEFWKQCRDYRHLSYADILKDRTELERQKQLLQEELELTILNAKHLSNEEKERSRRASIEMSDNVNIEAAFELMISKSMRNSTATTIGNSRPSSTSNSATTTTSRDSITIDDLRKLMELLRIECDERNVEFVANMMQIKDGLITRSSFIRCLQLHSRVNNNSNQPQKFQRRISFSSIILVKLAQAINDANIGKLRMFFQIVDKDNSGTVDIHEFASVLKALGNDIKDESKLRELYDEVDIHNKGYITFPQFITYWCTEHENTTIFTHFLYERASTIFKEYISEQSAKQVNIKGETRVQIRKILEAKDYTIINVHLFDQAEIEILKLLSADSFARFKQSELFQQFLNSANSYKHLLDSHKATTKNAKVRSGSLNVNQNQNKAVSVEEALQQATLLAKANEKARAYKAENNSNNPSTNGNTVTIGVSSDPPSSPSPAPAPSPTPSASASAPSALPAHYESSAAQIRKSVNPDANQLQPISPFQRNSLQHTPTATEYYSQHSPSSTPPPSADAHDDELLTYSSRANDSTPARSSMGITPQQTHFNSAFPAIAPLAPIDDDSDEDGGEEEGDSPLSALDIDLQLRQAQPQETELLL